MSTKPEQSPEYIEEQIERTRQEWSETVTELQNRLAPTDMFDRALDYVKTNQEFRRTFVTTIRDNPMPVCLIGIGLVWLFACGASEARRHSGTAGIGTRDSFDADPLEGDPRYSDHPDGPDPQHYPSGAAPSTSDKGETKQKLDEAKAKASDAADTVKRKL